MSVREPTVRVQVVPSEETDSAGSSPALRSPGRRLIIECSLRSACEAEARRHCPSGYETHESTEKISPGMRNGESAGTQPASTRDPQFNEPRPHPIESPVREERLVVSCR